MKFLVADDHPLVRRALSLTLRHIRADALLLEAATVAQALEQLATHPDIDLVLLDLGLPDADGVEALMRLRAARRDVPIAVVSGDETPATALRALGEGAAGYLPKSLPEDVLRAALGLILAGGTYVPPLVAGGAGKAARGGVSSAAATPTAMDRAPIDHDPRASGLTARGTRGSAMLTPRQRMVLELVIEGLSNREIADRLDLAEATIKVHMTAILRAYGVNNRAKAISAAQRERGARAGREMV